MGSSSSSLTLPSDVPRTRRLSERSYKFFKASCVGNVQLVLSLLEEGQQPNTCDKNGETALHWACYYGNLAVVKVLIAGGSDVTIVDMNGRNALHHACREGHIHVAEYLIQKCRKLIDLQCCNGDTPLHKSVRGGCVELVKLLVFLGADPTLKNMAGRTPFAESVHEKDTLKRRLESYKVSHAEEVSEDVRPATVMIPSEKKKSILGKRPTAMSMNSLLPTRAKRLQSSVRPMPESSAGTPVAASSLSRVIKKIILLSNLVKPHEESHREDTITAFKLTTSTIQKTKETTQLNIQILDILESYTKYYLEQHPEKNPVHMQ